MNSTQQHLLDAYRARSLGEPVPPAPGTRDRRVVRERRSRPVRHGLRDVLGRLRRRPT
ncbi:hypothetical protein [Streptomyces qaidamensis]|uniref:hypothetical protein n=1 Tax=Streptomyces qaidamensis TaxID=1783515 RepID=UPI000A8EED86|nr:hypothetical protein [Streptomyces qaidamensis]